MRNEEIQKYKKTKINKLNTECNRIQSKWKSQILRFQKNQKLGKSSPKTNNKKSDNSSSSYDVWTSTFYIRKLHNG